MFSCSAWEAVKLECEKARATDIRVRENLNALCAYWSPWHAWPLHLAPANRVAFYIEVTYVLVICMCVYMYRVRMIQKKADAFWPNDACISSQELYAFVLYFIVDHKQTLSLSHARTNTHTLSLFLPLSRALSLTHTQTHKYSHTYSHILTYTYEHTHMHTHTHSHTFTHSYTQTHTRKNTRSSHTHTCGRTRTNTCGISV